MSSGGAEKQTEEKPAKRRASGDGEEEKPADGRSKKKRASEAPVDDDGKRGGRGGGVAAATTTATGGNRSSSGSSDPQFDRRIADKEREDAAAMMATLRKRAADAEAKVAELQQKIDALLASKTNADLIAVHQYILGGTETDDRILLQVLSNKQQNRATGGVNPL